ncbi:MAG: diheme cytochrome C [Phormidesmis sp.]
MGLCSFAASLLLGIGLAHATSTAATSDYGMVDPIDEPHAVGYHIYIEQCATCHVALPPAVLPTQTWQTLITDSAHYGLVLPNIAPFEQQLMLNYLQVYSRSLQGDDPIPYRLQDSTYFGALHPNVALPQPLDLSSCAGCHIGATEQNYRS